MKSNFSFLLLVLLALAACIPATPASIVSPGSAPVSVGSCLITPHNYSRQDSPIPMAVLVNVPGSEGLGLIWRDGTSLGAWQTGLLVPRIKAHVAGSGADGVEAVPLVFLASGENGLTHLNVSLGGQISSLNEFPQTVTVTGLIGIPGMPVTAYSTIE